MRFVMLAEFLVAFCGISSTSPRQFFYKRVYCSFWVFFHIFLGGFLDFRLRKSPLTWLGLIFDRSNEQSIMLSAH